MLCGVTLRKITALLKAISMDGTKGHAATNGVCSEVSTITALFPPFRELKYLSASFISSSKK
jgi:hypothetical protein